MKPVLRYQFSLFAVILSSLAYYYHFHTDNMILRGLAAVFLLAFYWFTLPTFTKVILNKIKLNKVYFIFVSYTVLLLIVSFFQVVDFKNLFTLFFHPLGFPAFYIAIVAVFASSKYMVVLKKTAFYVNIALPIATVLDVYLFDYPIFLISCIPFLIYEFLTLEKGKYFRKTFLLILLLGAIQVFRIYDFRIGIILILLILVSYIISKYTPIIKSKFLRKSLYVVGVLGVFYLLFNFSDVYNLLTSYLTGEEITLIDTRSFLLPEFFSDLNIYDIVIGRGLLGEYFSTWFNDWQGEGDSYNRFSIEIGFLQFILKGGAIFLILFCFNILKAIYNGFTKYNIKQNEFLLAVWLFIEFALMAIQNYPMFGIKFFFYWVLIGMFLSKKSQLIKNVKS